MSIQLEPVTTLHRIRDLNDQLRQTLATGRLVVTPGVRELADSDLAGLLRKLRTFTDFAVTNDPHGEHDFGAIEHAGARFFFKIDYYDPTLECGSTDPADPTATTRVLTLMRADEY